MRRVFTLGIPLAMIATLGVAVSIGGFPGKKVDTQQKDSPDTLYAMMPEEDFVSSLSSVSRTKQGYVVDGNFDDETTTLNLNQHLSVLKNQWSSEVEKLEQLHGLYTELLTAWETEHRAWNEQSSRLQFFISAFNERLQLLEQEVFKKEEHLTTPDENLRVTLDSHSKSLGDLAEAIALLEKRTNSLSEILNRFDPHSSEHIVAELVRLEDALDFLAERVTETEIMLENVSMNITSEDSALDEAVFEDILVSLSTQMEGVVTQINTSVTQLDQYYNTLESRVLSIEGHLKNYHVRLIAVEQALMQTQSAVRHLEKQVDNMVQTTEQLEQRVKASNQRIGLFEEEWQRVFTKWDSQFEQIATEHEGLKRLKADVLTLIEAQEQYLEELGHVVNNLGLDVAEIHSSLTLAAGRDLQTLDDAEKIASIAVELSRLGDRIEDVEKTGVLLFEEITHLISRLREFEEDFSEREDHLANKIVSLRNYIDEAMEVVVHASDDKFSELDTRTSNLHIEHERLEQVVDVLMERVVFLEEKGGQGNPDELQHIAQLAIETLFTTQELMASMSVEQEELKALLNEQSATIELLREELDELRYINTGANEVVSYSGGVLQ